jgi:hypothetical protein
MTPFQNPTIYIGDLRIDEPITTLTDLLFIGVCFMAFFKTKHVAHEKAANIYRWFFLLTGASTLVAALIGHAFLYHFGIEAKILKNAMKQTPINNKSVRVVIGSSILKSPIYMVGF